MDDIDMDIDFGDPVEETEVQPHIEPIPIGQETSPPEATALPTDEPVLNKVHIRGLDELTTKDIESYSTEHFPAQKPKVEWVDDTSANLVFDNGDVAQQALRSLSVTFNGELPNPLQVRTAKSFSAQSSVELQVRIATITDRKPPRAHERSRFYMMHPEHDPREQKRQDSSGRNGSRRNDRLSRRRRSIERNHFDVSMYDDDSDALARRGRKSRSSFSSGDMRDSRSRDRDRSASPSRDNHRRSHRRRSPPPRYSRQDPHPAARRENLGKELFPNGASTNTNKAAAANIKKELFPHLKSGSTALHRRTNSIDATHDPTSDVLSSSMSSKMATPLVDGANDSFPLHSDSIEQKSGFTIKGAAKAQDQGFSIRGAAESRVKELFPSKVNNAGKELFANRVRNKADMFY